MGKKSTANASKPGDNISISHPFNCQINESDIGRIYVARPDQASSISVKNNGSFRSESLRSIMVVYSKPTGCFSLTFEKASEGVGLPRKKSELKPATIIPGRFILSPGSELCIRVSCAAEAVGLHKAALRFNFVGQKLWMYIMVAAEDDVARSLAPSQPFERAVRQAESVDTYVPGEAPLVPQSNRRQLKKYPLPDIPVEVLLLHSVNLSYKSYKDHFSSLVYAEEIQWKEDICAYDMENATMQQDRAGYLVLSVPGLLERRPSVVYGDKIYVKPNGSKDYYQGFVHQVQAEQVLLRFHARFHQNFIAKQQYKVRFSYSRTTIRRALRAIELAKTLPKNFLFPHHVPEQGVKKDADTFALINRALNEEQMESVAEILKKLGGPPYLIHGPPGTGKTVTIVEAILQVLKRKNEKCHILACAPSNTAADVLLDRLRGCIQVKDMIRVNAYTRQMDDVAAQLRPYCHADGTFFSCPPLEELVKYKVVVSTYFSVALLEQQGLKRGHFSHIFLDEAGQAMEPEALVALAHFGAPTTVVVLAGDHLQLGPVIRSRKAAECGLETSLLERLSNLPLYSHRKAKLELNRSATTRLVRNYRSHKAILDLPSRLFYNGELVSCGLSEICHSMCGWEELPNKDFPVLFVGVEGVAQREAKSPSWFNAHEVSKVVELVDKLKKYRRNRLVDNDIGIISPYSQQVKKIKSALASKNIKDIKIGSVEQFQGQEKRVIIISVVRSTEAFLETEDDSVFSFLNNPKRFNVAITRAKALLIVIGNPHVLEKHEHWKELLEYCQDNNSYCGCTPPAMNKKKIGEFQDFLAEDVETQSISRSDIEADNSVEASWPDGTR